MKNTFLDIDRQIVGEIYTSRETMENVYVLCDDFGSRFGGTAGERQAADYMAAKLTEYGLQNVHLEPVPYIGWTRGQTRLTMVSPIQKEIACISLPHSPPADLELELVDMGDGAPGDFDRRAAELAGKAVMTTSVVNPRNSRRWIHRSEKYGRSLLAGAKAFLFVNHYPGLGPATGSIGHDGEALIPGVSISHEDGEFIKRVLKRHGPVRIHIESDDHSSPMTSWNVLGELPGRSAEPEMVMLGCHYDGHDIAQGADDPVSGVVAVLEAARVLAAYAPTLPHTVRFALWGVEEIDLLGSRAYVAAHADDLARVRFYLNMDSAGSAVNRRDIVLNEWPELELTFAHWSEEMAWPFAVGQSLHAFSDHFPFFMAGVPTGGLESAQKTQAGRGFGHTRYDTVDKLEINALREAAAVAARLAVRIASDAHWSVARRSKQAVQELLDGPEYREERRFREQIDALYRQARVGDPA